MTIQRNLFSSIFNAFLSLPIVMKLFLISVFAFFENVISATLLSHSYTECMMVLTFVWYCPSVTALGTDELRLLALRLHTHCVNWRI